MATITFIDKGDKIKILKTFSGSDVTEVQYCDKVDTSGRVLRQKVIADALALFYQGDEGNKVFFDDPEEFKDVNGGSFNGWDEVTDFIQGLIDSSGATVNTLEVAANTTIDSSNILQAGTNAVFVDTSSLAISLDLDTSISAGTILFIKDDANNAGTLNITISGSAQTIDGAGSLVISTNYGKNGICKKNGSEWFVIS